MKINNINSVEMSKIKNRLVVIVIILLVIFIGRIILVKYAFSEWTNGIISQGEEILKSNLGDEFIAKYETRNSPDLETSITIMDSEGKKIIYFAIEEELNTTDLEIILHNKQVRCYKYKKALIYIIGDSGFRGVTIGELEEIDPTLIPEFEIVAKLLVGKNDWKWIKICGNYLYKAGDDDMKQLLLKYSLGQFTNSELDSNINSEFSKEDMQEFAIQVLNQD
ncbi:MAG: hypothetical protein K0R15_2658 [Clostridiales bacterium]|jgi:hypothetical protein|nr:hypothetical protein [Clostridiales bacterium]